MNSGNAQIQCLQKGMVISMRVIAGKARRMSLITPSGNHTRPTTDRIKETLFNMLQPELADCRFLDLFSGSGGIAIEALSRGAKEAVMVDNDREAVRCIKENVKKTGFTDVSRVMPMEVMQALRRLEQNGQPFDIIFLDPPYRHDIEKKIIEFLVQSSLVKEGTLIIAETSLDTDISYMNVLPCTMEKIKDYKTNRHVFLRIDDNSNEGSKL